MAIEFLVKWFAGRLLNSSWDQIKKRASRPEILDAFAKACKCVIHEYKELFPSDYTILALSSKDGIPEGEDLDSQLQNLFLDGNFPLEEELSEILFFSWQKRKQSLGTSEPADFFKIDKDKAKGILEYLAKEFFKELSQIDALSKPFLIKKIQEMSSAFSLGKESRLKKLSERLSNTPSREFFIGRDSYIDRILAIFRKKNPTICIEGMPGIGKSDLAIACSQKALESGIFDIVVWTKDYGGTLTLSDILDVIALRFETHTHATKSAFRKKQIYIRDILSTHRCLVIVDNYETITDGKIENFGMNCPEPSRFLYTSREKRPQDAYMVHLNPMNKEESITFLKCLINRLAPQFLKFYSKDSLRSIAEKTGRNPLALKWFIGQIIQAGLSVESVMRNLDEGSGDVFNTLFQKAWYSMSLTAQCLLKACALLPAPATMETMIRVSNIKKEKDSIAAIKQLVNFCLLEPSSNPFKKWRRYSMHPLTKSFAVNELYKDGKEFKEMKNRAVSYWLHFSEENGGMQWNWDGYKMIHDEVENIFSSIHFCYQEKRWEEIKQFRNHLSNALSIRGLWQKRIQLAELALEAAEKTGDAHAAAWCLVYDLAYIDLKIGDLKNAKKRTMEGKKIFKNIVGDQFGMAASYHHLGKIEEINKNYPEARNYYNKSMSLYAGDEEYMPFLLSELAIVNFKEEKFTQAESQFLDALESASGKQGKCEIVVSRCSGYLGVLKQMAGDFEQAEENFRFALKKAQDIGRADEIALNALRFAQLLDIQNNSEKSLCYAKNAQDTYRQIGDQVGEEKATELIERLERSQ